MWVLILCLFSGNFPAHALSKTAIESTMRSPQNRVRGASVSKAIGNCFERANLPTVTEEQRTAALTFAVVGAGPTGVECCAELRDFIEEVRQMCSAVS